MTNLVYNRNHYFGLGPIEWPWTAELGKKNTDTKIDLRNWTLVSVPDKGLSVNEDYNYLWVVHSFDVETFEFSVVLFLLLSSECGVSFYWGPARVNFDSSLFWNCIFTTEKNLVNTQVMITNLAGTENSNFSTSKLWTAGNQM